MCLSTIRDGDYLKKKGGGGRQEGLYSERSAGLRFLPGKADGRQVEFSGREHAAYVRKGNWCVTWMLQGYC